MTIILNAGTLWSVSCFYDDNTLVLHPEVLHLNSISVSKNFIINKLGFPVVMENPGMFDTDIVTITEDMFEQYPEFWVNAMLLSPYIINCNNSPQRHTLSNQLQTLALSSRNSAIEFLEGNPQVEEYVEYLGIANTNDSKGYAHDKYDKSGNAW